jgi:Leucine-rich repeat (LRR) protein
MPCESIVKRDADAIFAIDPRMDPRYSPRLNCSSEGRVISLDLRDFNVTSLSPRVNDLMELLELRIDGNRQLGVLPEMPSLTKLQVLSANTTLLTAVPDLSAFTELVTLELGINRISSIPDSIGGCKKLKTLGVFGNEGLTELPPSVAGLCSLENLWMNACAFKALPDLSCMRNLTQLVANGNAIEVVPMSIGIDNPKLQILMLQENKVTRTITLILN